MLLSGNQDVYSSVLVLPGLPSQAGPSPLPNAIREGIMGWVRACADIPVDGFVPNRLVIEIPNSQFLIPDS
jgi:hypothetical protein